jgi:hypothetical protein
MLLAPAGDALLKLIIQAIAAALLRWVSDDQESFGDPALA